jgi:hypothetical protein
MTGAAGHISTVRRSSASNTSARGATGCMAFLSGAWCRALPVAHRPEAAFVGTNRLLADLQVNRSGIASTIELRIMKRRELESLILPVILLLTGLILVGGDRVGILSLDRIQNLWPVALILVGLTDLLISSSDESGRNVAGPSRASREDVRRV